jgi:hypothetical protein
MDKRELAKERIKYILSTFKTTDEIIQSIINDIKMYNLDQELFECYQEALQPYIYENMSHIGTPEFLRYLDMVVADNTWMYVLMNKEDIKLYKEYQDINEKYHIHNI